MGSPAGIKGTLQRRTALNWPLLLFLGAAFIGLWAAYDRGSAFQKLLLLLGAYLLYTAIVVQPLQRLWKVVAVLAALGSAIAIFFLLTMDWRAHPPEFGFARRLVDSWAAVRPSLSLSSLHPNVAGGLIALLLPFQIGWMWRARRSQDRAGRPVMAIGLLVSLLALIISSSRGAIFSLLVALAFWALLQMLARLAAARQIKSRLPVSWLAAAVVVIIGAMLTAGYGQLGPLLARLPLGAGFAERAGLAAQTRHLIADFPLLGGGLAAFPGLHSRYILGIPYFFLPNGHNIFLDVFLEQGLLGVIAFIVIVATTFWRLVSVIFAANGQAVAGQAKLLAGVTLSSFTILLLHGLVEDTVYGSAGLPLLLVAPALAIALHDASSEDGVSGQRRRVRVNRHPLLLCGALLLASVLLPAGRAAWLANIASLHMARVELDGFPHDQWRDDIDVERLAPARALFEQSIGINQRQSTAYYRLGLIAMLRHDYEEAVHQLQRAHQNNAGHVGIRKALGYSYAWTGNVEQGSLLLSQAPFVNQELQAYENWWQSRGRDDLASITAQLQQRIQAMDQDS